VTHRWSQNPRVEIPNNQGVSGWVFVAALDAFPEEHAALLAAMDEGCRDIILGIGGLAFLSVFLTDREHWWALFPAFGLFLGGSIIFLEQAYPWLSDDFGGVIALGGIGLVFLLIFITNIKNWWALIPAGVLLSLAVMLLLGFESGGVFLIGLGLTFGVLGFVPTEHGRMRWAFIPAVVLILVGIFVTLAIYDLFALLCHQLHQPEQGVTVVLGKSPPEKLQPFRFYSFCNIKNTIFVF